MKLISAMRPFITIAFVVLTAWLTFMGRIEPREILTITGMIVSFWFGERAALKRQDKEKQ